MKIIKHYVTANRSDEDMEFLGYVKDEKGWSYITEEPETEEEKEELYSSFVIFQPNLPTFVGNNNQNILNYEYDVIRLQREENDGAVYCRLTDNIQQR